MWDRAKSCVLDLGLDMLDLEGNGPWGMIATKSNSKNEFEIWISSRENEDNGVKDAIWGDNWKCHISVNIYPIELFFDPTFVPRQGQSSCGLILDKNYRFLKTGWSLEVHRTVHTNDQSKAIGFQICELYLHLHCHTSQAEGVASSYICISRSNDAGGWQGIFPP